MPLKPDRRYRRRAAWRALRVTYRSAIAICATLPLVLAPAVAQTAEGENAAGFVTRLGQIAGNLYGAARRDIVDPARQRAADLLADLPRELPTTAAGEQLNAAARAVATTARSVVLEPVARQSAEMLERAEPWKWYQAGAAMARGAGGSRNGKSATSPRPRLFARRITDASDERSSSGSVNAGRFAKSSSE